MTDQIELGSDILTGQMKCVILCSAYKKTGELTEHVHRYAGMATSYAYGRKTLSS
jgi:hypothetical protein